jgi:hypothetical protein
MIGTHAARPAQAQPRPHPALLDLLGSAGYIFLVIDAELGNQVFDAISYYLHMRDITPEWEPELEQRYQNFPINRENRLTLVTELDTLYELRDQSVGGASRSCPQ